MGMSGSRSYLSILSFLVPTAAGLAAREAADSQEESEWEDRLFQVPFPQGISPPLSRQVVQIEAQLCWVLQLAYRPRVALCTRHSAVLRVGGPAIESPRALLTDRIVNEYTDDIERSVRGYLHPSHFRELGGCRLVAE